MNFRLPFPNLFSSIPDFVMGLAFLATWIDPYSLGNDMISFALMVMLLEFIIIHSSAFIGSIMFGDGAKKKKVIAMIGFSAFYMIFVLTFSLGFGDWWPVIAFTGLMLNRLLSVIVGDIPEGEERERVRGMWAINVVCYLVGVFATTLLPVPEFGITPDVVSAAGLTGEGIWIDEPYRVVAFGFFYFTAVGVFELTNIWIHYSSPQLQQPSE
jgi:hypothetical protein